jgi:hypothetical protein
LIQSFAPGETTPEQAHEIGQKLAVEILGGQYAYVLATHLDRGHIHNHYVWCAVNIETHTRYVSNKASYHKIQEVSDRLCAEYSLSVITEKSGQRGKSYTEYQADKYGTSWKTLLRRTIDAAVRSSNSFDDFLTFMKEAGYEIKHGKHISFRAVEQQIFTRAKTVGDNYTEEKIRERIAADKSMIVPKWIKPTTDKIIDRKDRKISSPAYSHWATKHNLHAMVDTHNYLAKHHDFNLTDFENHYADCVTRRNTAQEKFDQMAKQIAADKSIGIADKIQKHNALKTNHAKELTALNSEIVEMDRIRANFVSMHGEEFYQKNSTYIAYGNSSRRLFRCVYGLYLRAHG